MELPEGRLKAWLERDGLITPFLTEVGSGDQVEIDAVFAPAADIRVPEPTRLFDVEARESFRDAFERVATDRAFVPAGRVVGAAIDGRGMILSLSRPVRVPGGGSVALSPDRGTHVIAILARPRRPSSLRPDSVTLTLQADGALRPPDVWSDAGDRVLAIWYDVAASRANISAKSDTLELEPVDIVVRPNRVSEVRAAFRILPSLEVTIAPTLQQVKPPIRLSVARAVDLGEVRGMEVVTGHTYRIEALPRDLYSVALFVDGGEVEERVDLSSGSDESLSFVLEPITVSGIVRHGRDPARAKVSFRLSRARADAESDEFGHYELVLWQPRLYEVLVTVLGDRAPPLKDFVRVSHEMTYDVNIPDTDVRVRVLDARSQEPVAGAVVGVLNSWGGTEASPEHRQSQTVSTDDDGIARFAPLRPGNATIHVSARGYLNPEARGITIVEEMNTIVEIAVEPEGETRRVRLLLPDGTPASGAEVLSESGRWKGMANEDGFIAIPRIFLTTILLVRHPRAASAVRRFEATQEVWRLGVPSPPLRLRVERWAAWPAPVDVTLWIDDTAVRGTALLFLTGAPGSLPSYGDWVAANLPVGPLRIIARQRGASIGPAAEQVLAATIPFPWPPDATIRVVE